MAHMATFAGCVYVAPVSDDGTLLGPWEFLGQVAPLSVQLQDEEPTPIKGRTCEDYGKVIASKPNPGTASGSLTMYEYTAANVARALKGIVTTTDVEASTITDQSLTFQDVLQFIDVGKEELSNVVVKDENDNVLVAGEDYHINPHLGLIAPKKEDWANKTVKVSASCAEYKKPRVVIGGGGNIKYAMKGSHINEFNGERSKFYLRKVLFSSSAEIVTVSEDGTEREGMQMALTPEIPTGQSDYGHWDGLPLR